MGLAAWGPVLTTMLAKGFYLMDHPIHMGIHMGRSAIRPSWRWLRRADLTLALEMQHTDMNFRGSRSELPPERTVWGARVT